MKVVVKWNKLTIELDADLAAGVDALKSAIRAQTGVPNERQKLMSKGAWTGTLKDDAVLSTMTIKEGQVNTMMGTADVIAAPKEAVKFVEDMTAEEKAEKGVLTSAGLANLGNTCYMNSTVQCLRHMPELREALDRLPRNAAQPGQADISVPFSACLGMTFRELDRSGSAVAPGKFVTLLRSFFPLFNQQNPENSGRFVQQDAEEFYGVLTQNIGAALPSSSSSSSSSAASSSSSASITPFDSILGLQIEETITCQETDLEPPKSKIERAYKLVCNIDGGPGVKAIEHIAEGVKLGLEGDVELHSAVLSRNAVWRKKQRIASLPRYLCFHFMRFFWKATPESRDHQGVKCKIRRAVITPNRIDMYDFCNEALQAKLRVNRANEEKRFEQELAAKRHKGADGEGVAAAASSSSTSVEVTMTTEEAKGGGGDAAAAAAGGGGAMDLGEEDEELRAAMALSLGATVFPDATAKVGGGGGSSSSSSSGGSVFGNGLPDDFTGMYELHSVVSHKGASADSGHYIGWVRQEPGSDFWWKYNDDKVTETKTEEIMLLKGGGDFDMCYLCFYRYIEPKH